jgi:hypothetical protein
MGKSDYHMTVDGLWMAEPRRRSVVEHYSCETPSSISKASLSCSYGGLIEPSFCPWHKQFSYSRLVPKLKDSQKGNTSIHAWMAYVYTILYIYIYIYI